MRAKAAATLAVLVSTLTAAQADHINLSEALPATSVVPENNLTLLQAAYQAAGRSLQAFFREEEQKRKQTIHLRDGSSLVYMTIINSNGQKIGTGVIHGNKTTMRDVNGKFVATIVSNEDGTRTMYDESGNPVEQAKGREPKLPGK